MLQSEPATRAARIISISFRRDALDTVIDLYRASSVPLTVVGSGLEVLLGLVNRDTGQSASLTIWETEADREASGVSQAAAENLMQYAPYMTGAFLRDNYDATVVTLRPPPAPDAPGLVNLTVVTGTPASWETLGSGLRRFVRFSTPEHPDCYGAALLEQPFRRTAVVLTVAASASAMALYAGPLRDHLQGARSRGALDAPPRLRAYDLMAWRGLGQSGGDGR
jgi:hypothetical protein